MAHRVRTAAVPALSPLRPGPAPAPAPRQPAQPVAFGRGAFGRGHRQPAGRLARELRTAPAHHRDRPVVRASVQQQPRHHVRGLPGRPRLVAEPRRDAETVHAHLDDPRDGEVGQRHRVAVPGTDLPLRRLLGAGSGHGAPDGVEVLGEGRAVGVHGGGLPGRLDPRVVAPRREALVRRAVTGGRHQNTRRLGLGQHVAGPVDDGRQVGEHLAHGPGAARARPVPLPFRDPADLLVQALRFGPGGRQNRSPVPTGRPRHAA